MAPRLLSLALASLCAASNASRHAVPNAEIAPGVKMPMLAFGTYRNSLQTCNVTEGVKQWLRVGGRHIDTAYIYETQKDVGKAMRESGVAREEIFLTTKVPGPMGRNAVVSLILNTSLPELDVSYIDLVLIHYPCRNLSQFPDTCGTQWHEERLATWQGLEELRRAGKIRAIGVSNYNIEHVGELDKSLPAVNQVEWHLGYHNETLLASMKQQGVTLQSWGTLTGPTATNPGVALTDPRLKAVAKRYNVSTAQVVLRWSVQKGVAAVTASCSVSHILGDLAAFDFDLSQADIAALDAMSAEQLLLV